jgi:hypothetical protein
MVKGHRPDRPPRPRDPVIVVDPPPAEPCGRARAVRFAAEPAAHVGAHVDVVPVGNTLWFIAGSARVGQLPIEEQPDIRNCIAQGWAFDGQIEELADGIATTTLRGHPTR